LGLSSRVIAQRIEQAVDMIVRLGAALRREAGRLVDDDRLGIAVDDEAFGEFLLLCGELRADGPGRARGLGLVRRGQWRDADGLAFRDPVARRGARAIDAQLPGARPARDGREGHVRHMALEPAVEPDAVILGGDDHVAGGLVAHATARIVKSPPNSASTERQTESSA
jgi:hypothetical protein